MNSLRSVLRPLCSARTAVIFRPEARRTILYLDGLNDEAKVTETPVDVDVKKREEEKLVRITMAWDKLTKADSESFKLPPGLLLQVFTHKSFRHGSHPYNERLALYGTFAGREDSWIHIDITCRTEAIHIPHIPCPCQHSIR
jgi:hypothetical protein